MVPASQPGIGGSGPPGLVAGRARARRAPALALAVAGAAAFCFSLWITRDQALFSDEWGRYLLYPSMSFGATLHGLSGHLVVGHVFLYRAVFELFGAGSYLPLRLIQATLLVACAVLFYLYLGDRVSPWPAVGAAVVLMFLGSAWEVVATPYGIVILLPIALGLAALNCLLRPGLGWEIGACALLTAAVFTQDFALPFLAGALVLTGVRRSPPSLRSGWVAGVPLLLYAAWFAWSRLDTSYSFVGDPVKLSNLAKVPSTVLSLCAVGATSAAGTFESHGVLDLATGFFLLALIAVLAASGRPRLRGTVSALVWVPVAMMLAFGFLVGLALGGDRAPTAIRYVYLATLLVLMFCLELLGRRRGPLAAACVVALLALGVVANATAYRRIGRQIAQIGIENRAVLGALDVAGAAADPGYEIASEPTRFEINNVRGFTAGQYRSAASRFGSPSLSPAEAALPPEARAAADRTLIASEGIAPLPVAAPAAAPSSACSNLAGVPGAPATAIRALRPGAALEVQASGSGSGVVVAARRFASSPQAIGTVPAGTAARVSSPRDDSPVPWRLSFATDGAALVCPLAAQG